MVTIEGTKGIAEVAVQQPINYISDPTSNFLNYINQTIFNNIVPYANMYSDDSVRNLYNYLQRMPIQDKYAEINAVTTPGFMFNGNSDGSTIALNNMLMNGCGTYGGYGYYGKVSESPKNNYQNPYSTVNNPINNTAQNGQSATSWYEAYRRSTNLTDEQRKLAAKHEKISSLTDPNGSDYQRIKQIVADLKGALETNEEGVAEATLRNLSNNPEELAAVELLYSNDTPGSSLRKDIVRNFNYWGFGWMGNRTAKAEEMLGLLNKVAFEHPGNFALAMANATEGWGAYEDTISSLVLDERFTPEFAYCVKQEYTGRTQGNLSMDINKKWTSYGGKKTAIQKKLAT